MVRRLPDLSILTVYLLNFISYLNSTSYLQILRFCNTEQLKEFSVNPSWPQEIQRQHTSQSVEKETAWETCWLSLTNRTPFPSMLLANIQSLTNKLHDFTAGVKYHHNIMDCNLLCFTETWLTPAIPDHTLLPSETFSVFKAQQQSSG